MVTICIRGIIICMVGKQIKQPPPGRNSSTIPLGEQQSYVYPIGLGQKFLYCKGFVRICCIHANPDSELVRNNPDGEISLPIYLSSQPFLYTNFPQQ